MKAFVSQETYDKYIGYLDKNNGKSYAMILGAAFALPGFPDDFLCMVSGLSKMSFKKFVTIFLLTKPVTLYLYTVIGYKGLKLFTCLIPIKNSSFKAGVFLLFYSAAFPIF